MELFQEFPLGCCFLCGCSDLGWVHNIEMSSFFCLFFSRKTSPEHISGDAEGVESRVSLQETCASGSLNGKLFSQEGKIAPDWCKGCH